MKSQMDRNDKVLVESTRDLTPPISDADLLGVVRSYLGDQRLTLAGAQWAPLGTPVNPGTTGLFRVSGEARAGDRSMPWSLVMKGARATPFSPDDPAAWNYWQREALAYQSGILHRLPAGAAAPRLAGVVPGVEAAPAQNYLCLEDVQDEPTLGWSLADHGALAQRLGQWAALPLREPLIAPWLCPAFLQGILQTGAAVTQVLEAQHIWELPHIAPEFPAATLERIRLFLRTSDRLLGVLQRLPQVLCHFDAHRNNVMRRRGADGRPEFVVIDWSALGLGAVGEEIGHQFATNVLGCAVPIEQAGELAEELIAAYARGLAAAGVAAGEVDVQAVRTGFTIATALRAFGFALPIILRFGTDPASAAAVAFAPRLGAAARALLPYLDAALALA